MKSLICAVIVLAVSTAQGDIIYVDASCPGGDGSELDPYCSIQTAIDNAVDTDEIVVAPGTYFECINFLGKAITLQSSDGADATTIDGTGNFHVVQCVSGEGLDTVLDGFTITGGNANGGIPDNIGGGMFNTGSSPTVMNCVFSGNTAVAGGGMFNYFGSFPTVTNCTFSGNSAEFGGGMFNRDSSPTVTNCVLWGDSPGEIGGSGTPTVTYSNVQGGFPGTGNIDADPLFVDPDNGDYRLQAGSPCIDAGHNWAIAGLADTDLDGNPRFAADKIDFDPGCGIPVVVDMGAYEYQGDPFPVKLGDTNGDGVVGINDFLDLLADWGSCTETCCLSDLDIDGEVGIADFLLLLANWTP